MCAARWVSARVRVVRSEDTGGVAGARAICVQAMYARRMRVRTGVGTVAARTVRAEHKNKAAVWQPCSLSIFDSIKLIQSGFFGFLGFFFPKKNPKWGVGQRPTYLSPTSGRVARSPAN